MGKPTGFMEATRELPKRRLVEERVKDWNEVYLPFPEDKLKTQAARCMDCGVPFCHTGCPLGKHHSGLERPRLPRPLARSN